MSKIRVLPSHVANQIAAGEVIERPASVIKELLENSIDAHARNISIHFLNGGKNYIRIEDDGEGMTPDDALLSLERHATSKIRAAKDLDSILSFGFRGEALPSIASISRFTLQTRPQDQHEGTEICMHGGKILHQRSVGMAPGTRIEVVHLFNTVPARRKFLKTDSTEAAHIIHLVRLYALAHPEVTFSLSENNRSIFKSPATQNLAERIHSIWKKSLPEELLPIQSVQDDLAIQGFISKPGIFRSTRQEIITMINGRPIDSRTLNFALLESYHTFIPKGRFPMAYLFLNMHPSGIDVNVHPAKREVRFRQEGIVRQFIMRAILDQLQNNAPHKAVIKFSKAFSQRPDSEDCNPTITPRTALEASQFSANAFSALSAESDSFKKPLNRHDSMTSNAPVVPRPAPSADIPALKILPPERPSSDLRKEGLINNKRGSKESIPLSGNPHLPLDIHTQRLESESSPIKSDTSQILPSLNFNWHFLNKIQHPYALFETDSGIVIFNYRLAHQRVFFESIQEELEHATVSTQTLLIPISFELSPLESATLHHYVDFLNHCGLNLESFGRNFFRLDGLPTWLSPEESVSFIQDFASLIIENGMEPTKTQIIHEKIARHVSLNSVRADDAKNPDSLLKLAKSLMACKNPYTCLRGQSIFQEITYSDFSKRLSFR